MKEYWTIRQQPRQASHTASCTASRAATPSQAEHQDPFVSEFDRHRLQLLAEGDDDEEWQLELRRYLQDMPSDVTRKTDIVVWWSVCVYYYIHVQILY